MRINRLIRENGVRFSSSISQILNNIEITYNVSTGDVLGVIDFLDSIERKDEESYFLFIIKFIYSIKMYEYYDKIFKINYSEIIEQEKEGKLALCHGKKELVEMPEYHKLLAGHLFNKHLVDFIPVKNDEDPVTNGYIYLKKIVDNKDFYLENFRFIEFIMLCTSGPLKNNDTIHQKKQVKYAHVFAPQVEWAIFDLFAFFYNITNIEACYRRFERIFPPKYIDKLLESNDTIWADFYKAANYHIKNKGVSIRESQFTTVADFKEIFDLLTCETDCCEQSDIVSISNPLFKHKWLSWCCIRNVDVYEDFVHHLEDSRNRSAGSLLADKIINFFNTVFTFQQATHDYINANILCHYKLNFTFVGVIISFLESLKCSELSLEQVIFSYSQRESISASKNEDELNHIMIEDIIRRIFKNGARRYDTILRNLDGIKDQINLEIYQLVRNKLTSFQGRNVTKEELMKNWK